MISSSSVGWRNEFQELDQILSALSTDALKIGRKMIITTPTGQKQKQ